MLRIRVLGSSVLALCLVATSSLVWSQAEGQSNRAFGTTANGTTTLATSNTSEFSIINVPAVQKELSLTDEQKAKVNELCAAFQQASIPKWPNGRPNFGTEESRKLLAEASAKAETFTKERKPELVTLLSAEQKTRLSEIMVQIQGYAAYLHPDVQEKLELTAEQKDKLTAIHTEYLAKVSELKGPERTPQGSVNREAMEKWRKSREPLVHDRDEAVKKLLTAEQHEKFAALKGKKFDQSLMLIGGSGPNRTMPNKN